MSWSFLACWCQNELPEINKKELYELPRSTYVPENYRLELSDNFEFFSSSNWSKGLTHDSNPSIRMIWNSKTGGLNLLNDQYAGYIQDDNIYIKNGNIYLENRKESIEGTNPVGKFEYSTGWMNSLQKINFNGSEKSVYIEIKAKFPIGDKVWPAIWLVDDSKNRGWPPEIDIWEYFGKFFKTTRMDQMYMRFIYGKWNDKRDHSKSIKNFHSVYRASSEWHIYGFEWTKDKMTWYIDGQVVHTKLKEIDIPSSDWPNKAMCLIINNGLLRVVDEGNTTFPNALILDYLEIFELQK